MSSESLHSDGEEPCHTSKPPFMLQGGEMNLSRDFEAPQVRGSMEPGLRVPWASRRSERLPPTCPLPPMSPFAPDLCPAQRTAIVSVGNTHMDRTTTRIQAAGSVEPVREPARKHTTSWSELHETALTLHIVEGLSIQQTADQLQEQGHSTVKRTIVRWMATDEWKMRAAALRKRLTDRVADVAICKQATRLANRDRRYRELQQVVEARAQKAKQLGDEAAPGEDTGWVVRVPTRDGGCRFQTDTSLAMTLLSMEKETAQELGQTAGKERDGGSGSGTGVTVVLDTGEELPSYVLTATVDALDALICLVDEGYDLEALSKEQVGTLAGFVAGAHLGFEEDARRLHEFLASVGRVVPTTTSLPMEGDPDALRSSNGA